jgi:hypothetical protein
MRTRDSASTSVALAMATATPSKDRNLLAVIGDEVCHHFRSLCSRGRPYILGHNHWTPTSWDWPSYPRPEELLHR